MTAPRGSGFLSRLFYNLRSRINNEYGLGKPIEKGKDHCGNTYYEIPADPSRGIRKVRRSFVGRNDESWSDPMPPEWEAWLRYRRDEPPTPEEIYRNMQLAANRKILGDESRDKLSASEPKRTDSIFERYPKYKEYQLSPDGQDLSRIRRQIEEMRLAKDKKS